LDNSYRKLTIDDLVKRIPDEEIVGYIKSHHEFDIIGQPRALKALRLGTEIRAKGYNIFATGLSGTGKRTAITRILKNIKLENKPLSDIAFVFNFRKPDSPYALYFPKGKAKEFKKDIHKLVEDLKSSIRGRLESKKFQTKKDRIFKSTEQRENKILSEFESKLAKENFQIVQIGEGDDQVTDIMPIYKGKSYDFEELHTFVSSGEIDESFWNETREKYFQFMDEMKRMFKNLRDFRTEMDDKISDIKIREVKPLIAVEMEKLKERYPDKKTTQYLDDFGQDCITNLYLFTERHSHAKNGRPSLVRYGVNIIVDHSDTVNVPVIFENHPSYQNLFGTVESTFELGGEYRTSFMMIRAGSFIQATGGFLVLNADDILREEFSWQCLKSALTSEKVEIQQIEGSMFIPGAKIKPEPIVVDVKVIVIGDQNLYDYLYSMDEDFQKLFKVPAEFDSVIEKNESNLGKYVGFIKKIVEENKLKDIRPDAIARVVEYGMRLAEEREYLTTRFSLISDIIKEADYWADKTGKTAIDGDTVRKAIDERNYMYNLPEEKIRKLIQFGDIILSISGYAVGKVNGLTILDRGYYAFGRPILITARISPGDIGLINIERESGLSGGTHDKGILILEGFMRSRYALDFPLSMTASICFEQSYSGIDGDSASSSEAYALLSAISGIPLRQDIAVTGSVNQMGEIQPIGGVTEKVEGFFNICKTMEFTGSQGVIIPYQNIKNLILCDEVNEEIAANRFHIWAISSIDQGMEILTGLKSGVRNSRNEYPAKSVNKAVEAKLKEMAMRVKEYGGGS
jgi:lon-related putative ATP-dependent protease